MPGTRVVIDRRRGWLRKERHSLQYSLQVVSGLSHQSAEKKETGKVSSAKTNCPFTPVAVRGRGCLRSSSKAAARWQAPARRPVRRSEKLLPKLPTRATGKSNCDISRAVSKPPAILVAPPSRRPTPGGETLPNGAFLQPIDGVDPGAKRPVAVQTPFCLSARGQLLV